MTDAEHMGRMELICEVERMREREAHFAKVLGVTDGGQYRNDWDARITRLVAERDRYREALGVCVDRLVHGALPGNEHWWELARPLVIDERPKESP